MKNLLQKYQFLLGILTGSVVVYFMFYLHGVKFIDWSMVASLAAVVTAITIFWQTRYTLKIQTLNQMLTSWQSPPIFPKIRQSAAETLLNCSEPPRIILNNPAELIHRGQQTTLDLEIEGDASNINVVLDFFEMIALFIKEGVLDFELTYQAFSWEMNCYWVFTESYIKEAQENDGDELWQYYSELMPRFIKRGKEGVTVAQAREFFLDESIITYHKN
jgi:hypothetical protein